MAKSTLLLYGAFCKEIRSPTSIGNLLKSDFYMREQHIHSSSLVGLDGFFAMCIMQSTHYIYE